MTVTAANNIYYTDEQLDCIKSSIQCRFASYAATYSLAQLYDTEPCDSLPNAELLLGYYWVISTWQQYPDGSTTGLDNFLSQQDFVTVVEAAKSLTNCRCG